MRRTSQLQGLLDPSQAHGRRVPRDALRRGALPSTRAALTPQFFSRYAALVQSDNYVTKRQSLKMLGEILLDRTNFAVMTRYIASEDNLKMMMNLLRDKSKNIQFEAFHVFKVRLRMIGLR